MQFGLHELAFTCQPLCFFGCQVGVFAPFVAPGLGLFHLLPIVFDGLSACFFELTDDVLRRLHPFVAFQSVYGLVDAADFCLVLFEVTIGLEIVEHGRNESFLVAAPAYLSRISGQITDGSCAFIGHDQHTEHFALCRFLTKSVVDGVSFRCFAAQSSL